MNKHKGKLDRAQKSENKPPENNAKLMDNSGRCGDNNNVGGEHMCMDRSRDLVMDNGTYLSPSGSMSGYSSVDQYSQLGESHGSMDNLHDNKTHYKPQTGSPHAQEIRGGKNQGINRLPTVNSLPMMPHPSRDETHISSFLLPVGGGRDNHLLTEKWENQSNSVLSPMHENWISWDDGNDDKSYNSQQLKLPAITNKQSHFMHGISHRKTLPSIDTNKYATGPVGRLQQESASMRRSGSMDSPWTLRTPIPDHLKHLSHDYEPIRVSSMPEQTHPSDLLLRPMYTGLLRHNSSPHPLNLAKAKSTHPLTLAKAKRLSKAEIEDIERKINDDLNDIIYKFRDRSLDT